MIDCRWLHRQTSDQGMWACVGLLVMVGSVMIDDDI